MKDTKKSRPGDCSTRTAAETAAFNRAAVPCKDSTTAAEVRQMVHIADFLSHGAQNAVPLRHLVQLTGLPGRDLRRQIEAARRAGKPIVSNDHGYFLAENPQEIARFVKSMRRRARQIQEVAAAVEGAEV